MAQYRILENGLQAARQLELEITGACRRGLEKGQRRFDNVCSLQDWEEVRSEIDSVFRDAFPDLLDQRAPIRVRPVSSVAFDDFIVENVLFESIPGWEVNASVYRPKQEGKYPGVVCPTGHSHKFDEDGYRTPQILARNGYIAVSFCPPGCIGELARLNDHFVNGLIGWLTGIWCQVHFVADALACIDYLATRSDVDATNGYAMTGVSGGGLTTIYCAAYDKRITFAAPVCCVADQEFLHLTGLYTSCPEQHGCGFHGNGIDMSELLSLIAPTPLFIVGGGLDTCFQKDVTTRVYQRVSKLYQLYGCPEKIGLYIQEDSDHAYTVKMANWVTAAMNCVFKNGQKPLPLTEEDMVMPAFEQLACYPRGTVNMFTVNYEAADRLRRQRPVLSRDALQKKVRELLQFEGISCEVEHAYVTPESELPYRWFHLFQPVVLHHHQGKVLPGLFAYRYDGKKRPGLLYLDEKGKWNGFNHGGVLNEIAQWIDPDGLDARNIFSVDVSGTGELEMQHTTYDCAGWNDIERILSYLSFADGRPLLAYQIRDALTAFAYLRTRPEVDSSRIVLAGRGTGAVVALFAGLLSPEPVEKVIAVEPLAAYHCLTESFPYNWPPTLVIPNVLKHFDLPDIVGALGEKAVCITPLDEMHRPLTDARMLTYYGEAIRKGAQVIAGGNPERLLVRACGGQL